MKLKFNPPTSKVQSMGVYAFGLPAVAIITQSEQIADYSGGDTNGVSQASSCGKCAER